MRDIIVPLDGSAYSERALAVARARAAALGGQLTLTQVVPRGWGAGSPPDMPAMLEHAAARYLDGVAQRLGDGPTETLVLRGDPADELLALLARRPRARIVMSTHGHGGLGRIAFGSVADKVMRGATASVTLVRSAATAPAAITKVLVPLDGSQLAAEALPCALELVHSVGATVHLVRVVQPFWQAYTAYAPEALYLASEQTDELDAQAQAEARAYLDELAGRLRAQGVRVEWCVRFGNPADEIVRAAETHGADLVVMATHGRGGLRRWALGSVTTEVAQRAAAPLMVVPAVRLAERPVEAAVARRKAALT